MSSPVISNKPLEWTGHLDLSASPPIAPRLPLRGSDRQSPLVVPDFMQLGIFMFESFAEMARTNVGLTQRASSTTRKPQSKMSGDRR